MKRGLYRIPGVGDLPNDVRVDDDGIEMPLEERLYRARGYQPPVDTLPWQDQYGKLQPSADSRSSTSDGAEKASRQQAREEFLDRFRKP
jgi:hypothetical protein